MAGKRSIENPSARSLAGRLLLFTAAMFGFGYLLVPAYDVFCEITGFGGRTNETPSSAVAAPDESRTIDLEFVTTVNQHAPWEFRPQVDTMSVHPGGLYEATFMATNLSDRRQIAQAVPSVTPSEAAEYFKKIDCFCFTTQEFKAGQTRDLLVRFIVDPDLPDYVDTITLSYTFFDSGQVADTAIEMTSAAHSPE